MQRPALGTAAGRPATADVEDTEGSGQAGCATGQLLQAAVEQTADERRVIRDAHGYPRYVAVKERSEAYKKKRPNRALRKKEEPRRLTDGEDAA
jgi:hypothetical protein